MSRRRNVIFWMNFLNVGVISVSHILDQELDFHVLGTHLPEPTALHFFSKLHPWCRKYISHCLVMLTFLTELYQDHYLFQWQTCTQISPDLTPPFPVLAMTLSHQQSMHVFVDMNDIFDRYACSASHICPWLHVQNGEYQPCFHLLMA